MFLLFNGRGRVWTVIVSGPDNRGSGQAVYFLFNRNQQLLGGAAGKIGSPHRPHKQSIPGKNVTVGVKTHTTRRVSRGVNYSQVGAVADLDEIVILQKNIRHRGSFAPEYSGEGLVRHIPQSVGIQFVYKEFGTGSSLNRLVSGGVIRMQVSDKCGFDVPNLQLLDTGGAAREDSAGLICPP